MAERKLSKNMQRIAAQQEKVRVYRASPERQAQIEKHLAWLAELGHPEEVIQKWRDRYAAEKVSTRKRRGKTVEIPEVWRGVVTHPQTIRKRKSKEGGKRTKMKKEH